MNNPSITLDEVIHLAEQLTPDEQRALITRLSGMIRSNDANQSPVPDRRLNLLVFDVGEWPPQLTLRC